MKTLTLITCLLSIALAACSSKKDSNGAQGDSKPTKDGVVVEGVINGGGGKGVLCDKNGRMTLKILDIYEGEHLYSNTYKGFEDLDQKSVTENILKRVDDYYEYPVASWSLSGESKSPLDELLKNAKFTSEGQSLKSTSDSDDVLLEQDCELVQIAVYYNDSVPLIDSNYWAMLDEFNKQALLAHEILYANQRLTTETKTSIDTRRLVAELFSDKGTVPRLGQSLLNATTNDFLMCNASDVSEVKGSFFLLQNEMGVEVIWNTLGHSPVDFYTRGQIDGAKLSDFLHTLPFGTDLSKGGIKFRSEVSNLPFAIGTIQQRNGWMFFEFEILRNGKKKVGIEVLNCVNFPEDSSSILESYIDGSYSAKDSEESIGFKNYGDVIVVNEKRYIATDTSNQKCFVEDTGGRLNSIFEDKEGYLFNTTIGYINYLPWDKENEQNSGEAHKMCQKKVEEINASSSKLVQRIFVPIDENSFSLGGIEYRRLK